MNKKNITLAIIIVLIIAAIIYIDGMKARPSATGSGGPAQAINLGVAPASSTIGTGPVNFSVNGATATSTGAALLALEAADKKAGYSPAIEIADPTGFVNASSSFRLAPLIGKKVILLDFWTYSCINCIRTLPYLTSWYGKYQGSGLEVVGIHTPEFDFEKNIANVQAAVTQYGIQYPVVLDSDYGTWQAYGNLYWPHEYLIDMAGYIVHDQIGEGNYAETEAEIQKLLTQRAQILGLPTSTIPTGSVDVTNTTPTGAMSPETYFGAERNEYLANGTQSATGVQSFTEPATTSLAANALYLGGSWDIESQYAQTPSSVSAASPDEIEYNYQAKGVYFVAGSANGSPIQVEVLRDGAPIPQSIAGSDIFYQNGKSYVNITGNRLYRIISDTTYGDHVLQFIISAPGLQAYTFTFG